MPDSAGDLALVLHSHMPYVEGFGTYPFGEEWLFDAVLRSYVPVLRVADRLTMTVTPVLADQLEADGVAERLVAFAAEHRVGAAEADAADVDREYRAACEDAAARHRDSLARVEACGTDLTRLFAGARDEGRVALMASAATHAVLPLVATSGGRRAQVDAGLRSHRRRFGREAGFWLPECAYEPGIEALLGERGIPCFCTDQSAFEEPLAALAPVRAGGTVALTIDWEAVGWLWSPSGYPSHPDHADSFRESGRGLRLWSVEGGAYAPARAAARAREQAAEFLGSVAARLREFRERHGRRGLLVFAIDTELLGHWWQEGPEWLGEVVRGAGEAGVEMVTVPEALERHEPQDRTLRRSTWGESKNLSTWDSPAVADIAWASRRLELRAVRALAERRLHPHAAARMARELMALQASDWAFLDRRGQAGDYPWERVTHHSRALLDAIHSAGPPDPRLRNLAPDLELAAFLEP